MLINKRRFQDAKIWFEIISLPISYQWKLRGMRVDMSRMKTLTGGCCNQTSEWIREDYYNEIRTP